MPSLAIGTANFGMPYGLSKSTDPLSIDSVAGIIAKSRSLGINCLDTANAYGNCQKVLGEIGVSDWTVVSKISAIPNDCSDVSGFVQRQIEMILFDLKVDEVETVLVHNAGDLLGPFGDQIFGALEKHRLAGALKKIGVSIYGPELLNSVIPRYQVEVVQAPLNVLDNRLVSSGWLGKLASRKVEVHSRSVFLQGLLLSRALQEGEYFGRWQEVFHRWNEISGSNVDLALQTCLTHVKSFADVSRVVVGIDSESHVEEIANLFRKPPQQVEDFMAGVDEDLINPSCWRVA